MLQTGVGGEYRRLSESVPTIRFDDKMDMKSSSYCSGRLFDIFIVIVYSMKHLIIWISIERLLFGRYHCTAQKKKAK